MKKLLAFIYLVSLGAFGFRCYSVLAWARCLYFVPKRYSVRTYTVTVPVIPDCPSNDRHQRNPKGIFAPVPRRRGRHRQD